MVFDLNDNLSSNNKTAVLRSYGWLQCRLSLDNSIESSISLFPLNARTIQVVFFFPLHLSFFKLNNQIFS